MSSSASSSRITIPILIAARPPQRPACFDTQALWVEWLQGAHEAGDKVVRRVDVGKRTGDRRTYYEVLRTEEIDYCVDCTIRRQQQMLAQGRCQPPIRHQEEEASLTGVLREVLADIAREKATGAAA